MPFKVGQVRAHVGCVKLTVNVDCLTKNKYNEAKCQTAINALYECCDALPTVRQRRIDNKLPETGSSAAKTEAAERRAVERLDHVA